ncbi:MAG: alpha/beta hydrolase [Alphaproteobacteria bacterium]|nr:alpha/beta hydrolase [Alphaproteobacteria bacterium]MBU1515988.1 alpha/beta hydrolase [Alphaproteobacteria bacterium]MBU2092797.1 alpha/beta hydrolase [Alphaproteobacteria bacterium]MBU2153678.1 alpha/beta hydrolase [Alphaproteobacteria bacterium]MBU2308306.1 alpha/beta hydrolase [Alphaproteobacteria bacterium]
MLKALLGGLTAAMILAAPATATPKDPNKLFSDSKIVVRDRFSVEVAGKGPDIVFIPGLTSGRATWKASADRLRATHRVHLIQIAGFAGEPARANKDGDVFVPTAEAIDAYLVDRKLGPVTVVGHSLGGSMALYLAQKHPEHVKRVMVVDSMPFLAQMFGGAQMTPESAKPMATAMRDGMAQGGETYAAGLKRQIGQMAKGDADKQMITDWGLTSDPTVAGRAMYDLLLLDQRPGLSQTKVPLTVVYPDNAPAGAKAGMMDGYYAGAYKPAPAVTLKRVDASLHFVMLDQPQAFAEALDAFLSQP